MKTALIEVCPDCNEQVVPDQLGEFWCSDKSHGFQVISEPLYVDVEYDPSTAKS